MFFFNNELEKVEVAKKCLPKCADECYDGRDEVW